MTEPCDCCTTSTPRLPLSTLNRPGLTELNYRIGTYADFFAALKVELSRLDLSGLKTRDLSDPAIAFLDAWAMVADVITFYQERIANEGYLRTAIERQSVLDLASLVGATLRPGVSASTSVAYTLDPGSNATIPVGSRVQSLPTQGQLPQSFEVSDDLPAQGSWNNLRPRLTRPQVLTSGVSKLYALGLSTNLKPNDPLLVIASSPVVRRIKSVELQVPQGRSMIELMTDQANGAPLQGLAAPVAASDTTPAPDSRLTNYVELLQLLAKAPPSAPPSSRAQFVRSVSDAFAPGSSAVPTTVRLLKPETRSQFFTALKNADVAPQPTSELYAFRVKAAPFGHNAPLKPITDDKGVVIGTEEWPLAGAAAFGIVLVPSRPVRRDDPQPDLEAVFTDVTPPVFVQIAVGTDKASRSFKLAGTSTTTYVGQWRVTASYDMEKRTFAFKFDDFDWSCELELPHRSFSLKATVNGAHQFEIPVGSVAENATAGDRLRISTERGIAIDHEAPVAPSLPNVIDLDASYDHILPQSWVAIEFPDRSVISRVAEVQKVSVARYGMTGRVTRLILKSEWLRPTDVLLSAIRPASVLAQSDIVDLAEEPIDMAVEGDTIELGDFYGDLPAGRYLIVSGERDVKKTKGVMGAELVMLAGTTVLPPDSDPHAQPGEKIHTQIKLASPLSYSYKRETVAIYGNVAAVTHGETKSEVLGSGDGSQANQRFTLKQGPLTHIQAANPSGIESSLEVRVNDIPWMPVSSLTRAGPLDRCYVTQTDDFDKATIIFGDGINGMRLPTGRENVTATYRVGIGSAGNVGASAISQLATRPYGVKAVVSPLGSSGGVDRDDAGQGKANMPGAAATMDPLVSIEDYANFARLFGGVGKASAIAVPGGRRPLVYLSVAGATAQDDGSGSFDGLQQALLGAGDPNIDVIVEGCELMLLIVEARVAVAAGLLWQDLEPIVRATLLGAFGFQKRDLGQSVAMSEVVATIQRIAGVAAVDVTALDTIGASTTDLDSRLKKKLAEVASGTQPASTIQVLPARIDRMTMRPRQAQLAFLSADLSDTLLLTEVST